ncbi:MAG: MFS transporter [Aphanocapsa sp. GSE-SYN-MK-11-07L]|nr:MFS transporter [Aphanocapsa sp. GSE-SYN-MK-11-07L]
MRSQALKFVILIGIVSLCADATYEGGRSIAGAYLGALGASGAIVGLVAGAGELVGFALRLLTGYLSDKTRQYWSITTLGYILNTGAIPLLALTGRWETAAALLILERAGRAVRSPPRDVLLSHAASQIGSGFGFGLHEALDQIGAVLGPLAVAALLARQQNYQSGFAILLFPALLGLGVLLIAQQRYPNPQEFEVKSQTPTNGEGLPRQFWIYLAGAALLAVGYADFPLIAFHFQRTGLMAVNTIPLFYAVAMAMDAISALLLGRLFDRNGVITLVIAVAISALFAPLAFLGTPPLALLGMALWGVGMGAQESIMKATVATIVPINQRGLAFGIFYVGYGLAWFAGSVAMGLLYDRTVVGLVYFSVVAQFAACSVLFWVTCRQD